MKISKKIYDRVSDITGIDYGAKILDEECLYLDKYGVESMFEDLVCEINSLEEKIEDMEQDIRDNYKPISKYEEIGMSERDFF